MSRAKENFTLYQEFKQPLDKTQFEAAKKKYLASLVTKPFKKLEGSTLEIINLGKRKARCFGPYRNLSYFEILNRVASDLVMLEGTTKLFNGEVAAIKPKTILLKLGNQGGADIEIQLKDGSRVYGEAFNASQSLAKIKMRHALKIIIERILKQNLKVKKGVVFYNAEINHVLKNISNNLEKDNQDIDIVRLSCKIR